jgi:hypothetical protein
MAKTKTMKRVVREHPLHRTHAGHNRHLCDLVDKRQMDRVAELARGAKYLCHICGRAAAKAENLCEAVEI